MDLGVISVRYARALLKCATKQKQETEVYVEMESLMESYMHFPLLRQTLDNPLLDNKNKINLLETACGGAPSDLTRRFFQLVLKEGRIGKITTAVAVSKDTEDKLRKLIEDKTHGTVEFNTEVDSEILGGFILEYDTFRMDTSVRTELKEVLTTLRN